jgi:hypothetical protein
MLTVSDLAPVIVAGVAAGSGLLMLCYFVRQAHAGDRKEPKAEREANRRGL